MTTTTKQRVPNDFPVKPLKRGDKAVDRATCGTCGRSWDDAIPTSYTPAPSARCPFEAFHDYDSDDEAPRRKAEIEAGFEAYLANKQVVTTQPPHTPTLAIGLDSDNECTQLITEDGQHFAYIEQDPHLEFARLIVRAVNNHDKLVEALREALPIVESAYLDDCDKDPESVSASVSFSALQAIKGVLAELGE